MHAGIFSTNSKIFSKLMTKKFEQLSNKPSYMKHNGGLLFRSINKKKFEFKTKIKKTHLNKAGITHGGYICTIILSLIHI